MPKITKAAGSYNLRSVFRSTITDDRYTQDDANNLLVWIKGNSTSNLTDLSSFARTVSETSLVSVENNSIYNQKYLQFFEHVNLNGTASLFSVPDANDISFGNGTTDSGFSVSMWVRLTDLGQMHGLFGKGSSSTNREYACVVDTNGQINFQVFDESTNAYVFKKSNDTLKAMTWHHVVITYNGKGSDGTTTQKGFNIYVDGVIDHEFGGAGGTYTAMENLNAVFTIGKCIGPTTGTAVRFLKGDIAEFVVWSKELSPQAVTALYHRKGYSAYESGYLNNPVRTLIRARDNRAGTYPTIHRMNKKDSTGILSNTVFDDTKTVKFGNVIKDNFTIEEENVYSKAVNSNLWKVSNTEVLVRKEFDPKSDLELTTGAVVLGGPGDTSGRWLQTVKKVRNPTLIFSLLQGPYNDTGALARFKLNLGKGALTDVFKVQVSINETNWVDVGLKNIHLGTNDVWVDSLIVNETSKHVVPRDVFALRQVFTALGSPETGSQFKPVLNFKLDMQDFTSTGLNNDIYIRFIQPTVSDANISVWAIGNINIISRNEQVTYPHLGTGDPASSYHLTQSIATPNFINSLSALGSSATGITDAGVLPFNAQLITPFNEDVIIESDNSGFNNVGTPENITPGFSQPLHAKTQFQYRMKPADSDVIGVGLTRKGIGSAVSLNNDDGQILLSYWNFKRNAWEEIGQPLRDNRGNHGSKAEAKAHLDDNITGSCAGFGPIIDSLTKGPAGKMKLNSPKAFEHAFLPVSTFGFPFAAKYHATSSQYVKASELGITKPFLLEKITLDLDIEFAVPGHNINSDKDRDAFAAIHIDETTSAQLPYTNRRLKIFTPTFFLLRQHLDKRDISSNNFSVATPGALGFPQTVSEAIPKQIKLTSGSNIETTVYDTRELITYGQYNLFVTASDESHGNEPDRLVDSGISMTDLLNSGIVRDGFSVKSAADAQVDAVYNVKDKMKFPVRIPGQHADVSSVIVHNNQPSATVFPQDTSLIKLENKSLSRKLFMDGNARAIVNGVSGLKRSNETLIVSQSANVASVNTFEKLTFESPYLILPEDEIIFGWQYPMPRDLRFPTGAPSATPNSMKVQDCNIKMFGSQFKNGKEFHEGLNQNLTSNAVHEVIGNEPVIDQWQIATRGEMTGSISDQFMFAIQTAPAGTEDFVTGYVIGSIISPPPDANTTNNNQLLWNVGKNPVRRVNSRFSSTLGNSFSLLSPASIINFLKTIDTLSAGNLPANSYLHQIQAFNNLTDIKRVFKDSAILNGTSVETSYGSSQNYSYQAGGSNIIKLGGSPKYYFSLKHYGYFSDLIRQGFDGKFKKTTQSIIDQTIVDSTVSIKFVEDSYDEDDLNFRKFSLIKPSDVDGTAYETFQSSNISLFATSSLPFFDDNVPLNRTYSVSAVEVT